MGEVMEDPILDMRSKVQMNYGESDTTWDVKFGWIKVDWILDNKESLSKLRLTRC